MIVDTVDKELYTVVVLSEHKFYKYFDPKIKENKWSRASGFSSQFLLT